MLGLERRASGTRLGLAYGPSATAYLDEHPDGLDYLEIPFEQLRHSPQLFALQTQIPLILHCASLSIAGEIPPPVETVAAIADTAQRIATPWIGEHLAFLSAESLEPNAPPVTLGYTVAPQLSETSIERVAANLERTRRQLPGIRLILENSPQYFHVPGSTMNMGEFVRRIAARCDVELLLDLTHFVVTCMNTGAQPEQELERLPLERVVEMHVSGLSVQSGVAWDDHAVPVPEIVFTLLDSVLRRARPQALTVEYNWSPHFPQSVLERHLARLRDALAKA